MTVAVALRRSLFHTSLSRMSSLRRFTARQALLLLLGAFVCTLSTTFVSAQDEDDAVEDSANLDTEAETPGSNNQPTGDESEDEDEVEPPPSDPEVDEDDKDFDAMDAMTPDDPNEVVEGEEAEVMSYDLQKHKAKLCLFAARSQATPQNELLKGALESYVKHSEGKLDEQKAQEMIMIHLFSRCWKKTKSDVIQTITAKGMSPEEEPFQAFLADNGLDKPLNPMKEQLKKDEWDVVNEVLEEERKLSENPAKQTKQQKKSQQKRQYRQQNSDIFGAPGMNMSTMSKYMYTLVVSVF